MGALLVIILLLGGLVVAAYFKKTPQNTEGVRYVYEKPVLSPELILQALAATEVVKEKTLHDEILDLKEQVKYYATGQHELKELPEFISLKDFNKLSDKWKSENMKHYKAIKSEWQKQGDDSFEETLIGYELKHKQNKNERKKTFYEKLRDNDPLDD
jgi:hypothetical protein